MRLYQTKIFLVDNPATHDFGSSRASQEMEVTRIDRPSIGIDDVRFLVTEAHRTVTSPVQGKLLVLSGNSITSEAQQAALKLFEEPPAGVQIYVVLPKGIQLIDTVLSRVQIHEVEVSGDSKLVQSWLAQPHADRLQEVSTRLKDRDIEWIQSFKASLHHFVLEEPEVAAENGVAIQLVLENLQTRGAANKMLLEYLALQLPLTE